MVKKVKAPSKWGDGPNSDKKPTNNNDNRNSYSNSNSNSNNNYS